MAVIENINYITHKNIDKKKWDNCIANCTQEMIYGYSWYLDVVSPDWDALVLNDYETVMPLPCKKKWGIQYLTAPPGVGQLGIFSIKQLSTTTCNAFLKAIPKHFKLIEIDLNFSNQISNLDFTKRSNYILPLNMPYEQLHGNYHRLARRKLKAAEKAKLSIIKDFSPQIILETAYNTLHQKTKFPKSYIDVFSKLVTVGKSKGLCHAYGVINEQGTLLASDIFFIGKTRISSVIAGNKPEGNENGAFYMVLNQIIQDYSNTGLILDFEGSDIEGIAFLFKNLGAQLEPYPHITINNLPWPLKLLK